MNFICYGICPAQPFNKRRKVKPERRTHPIWRIMKLTVLFLLVAFMQVNAAVFSQTVTYTAKGATLEKVLKTIGKQTGYVFFYDYEVVKNAAPVNVDLKDANIDDALKASFKGQHLEYTIENKTVVVSALQAASKPANTPVKITGKVVDSNNEILPGATITVKGKTTGVVTNVNGGFTIDANPGDVLVVSFVGMETREVVVPNPPPALLTVTLMPATGKLSEVVVVGYGTQARQDLSTSVATVGSKSLGRQVVSSFENALQGQAAGVQIDNPTGQPGSAINISIRGKNSLSLSTSPLYVIDGVPVQPGYDQELGIGNQRPNPLSSLNTSDIESIDVLKDGAAAAIYGSRASNGVVVVTTKRGKAGKPQVNFNMYYGQQKLVKKIKLLNGRQFASVFNQALDAAGENRAYDPDTVNVNTNWQDLLYQDAPMQNYQLSVQGGTDKSKYYISGAYFDQDGIIRNSGFKRYSVKINLDQQVTDRFKIGTSLNLASTINNRSTRSEMELNNSGVVLGALEQIPTLPVYNADGTYALNPFSQSDNPFGDNETTHNIVKLNQLFGNMYGEYNVMKGLKFRTSLGIDYRSQYENQFIARENPGFQNAASASRGSAATGTNIGTIWLWENTLTYDMSKGDHHLTLLGGQSMQNSQLFTSSASGYGFPSNAVPYLYAASVKQSISSYEEEWGLVSYFVRGNYNYKDRYYASASLRADGSSRFADNHKFGYFPAVSAAWRVSQEPFFNQNGAVNELKLRASFGANGNQNVGVNDRLSTYGTGYNYSNYNGDGSVAGGIAAQRIGNDNLRWETTYQYDAGFDIDLFSSRLSITADVYLKRTKDLLTEVPLSVSTGSEVSTIVQNLGQVQNKGIELGINTVNFRNANGFNWSTQFNFTLNRNKILDLGKLVDENGNTVDRKIIGGYSISQKGQPLGAFYGYVVQGIFQNQAEVDAAPTQPNASPGDYRFADLDGNGVIDAADRKIIGNPNPNFISGITNTFSYKGFDLSVFLQGSFGNRIFNQNRTLLENMVNPFNQSVDVLNAWTHEGQNTMIAREVYGDPNGNSQFSTRYLENGTYVRLKNLTFGYTFAVGSLKKIGLSSLRIYAAGQNIATITKYKGYDPEVNADPLSNTGFGRDYGVYPPAKTYTIGINAQF
ncbi:MAG: TonB-dependent receptor [Mucilaginibacter sp.]|nr:TonB-dependent receptor [Mucilaginibacter sp.]